jgi:hypothetical protein
MTAEIRPISTPWKKRITIDSYRQRRTGNTVFRAWSGSGPGSRDIYIPFQDPVPLARYLLSMLAHGYEIEWAGEPAQGAAAQIVDIREGRPR